MKKKGNKHAQSISHQHSRLSFPIQKSHVHQEVFLFQPLLNIHRLISSLTFVPKIKPH
jgi:hypothetical protein